MKAMCCGLTRETSDPLAKKVDQPLIGFLKEYNRVALLSFPRTYYITIQSFNPARGRGSKHMHLCINTWMNVE